MDENDGWEPGRWWRVFDRNGVLWCETSSEKEAREVMRKGDTLHHIYVQTKYKWVRVK